MKLPFVLFALFVYTIIQVAAAAEADPVVCIGKGCVRGKSFKGNLKEFEGFLGIPFAEPPVGELRLKDPVPLTEKWDGVFNATEEKMYCMQKNYLIPNPTVSGVEDCLFLYVYRPKNIRHQLPVLVYIHGGGLFAGAGGPSITGADYFMDSEDVIMVTMNYRLGPLGFLSTGDASMPGNFGLKDQALAIKWVKDNIKAFGGNASNIALMGQSAGSLSAHLHMMSSPTWSRNLFHKVVMLSGNGNAPYAYVIKDPLKQAKDFAKAVNIENYEGLTVLELAHKLRTSDPESLINACDQLKIWSVDPLTISRPVVEDCSSHDGFLCFDPVDLWRSGDFARVPTLSGFMDGDGAVRALAILENETQRNDLNKRFDELVPKLMEIENTSAVNTRNLKAIKKRYFNGVSAVTEKIIALYTERSFVAPLYNTLQQLVANDKKTPAFVYKFSFRGPLSYSSFYTGNSKDYGPVHCDELIYLLKSPAIFQSQDFSENSLEGGFRSQFVKFFTDFIVTGQPTKVDGRAVPKCEASKSKLNSSLNCKIVEFGENLSMKIAGELDSDAADFWNTIDDTLVKKKWSPEIVTVPANP